MGGWHFPFRGSRASKQRISKYAKSWETLRELRHLLFAILFQKLACLSNSHSMELGSSWQVIGTLAIKSNMRLPQGLENLVSFSVFFNVQMCLSCDSLVTCHIGVQPRSPLNTPRKAKNPGSRWSCGSLDATQWPTAEWPTAACWKKILPLGHDFCSNGSSCTILKFNTWFEFFWTLQDVLFVDGVLDKKWQMTIDSRHCLIEQEAPRALV